MIAVDTNVLVRYVTNDHQGQAERALRLLSGAEPVLLPKTVLLETEWVLRAVYRLRRPAILRSLLHVLGLPSVVPEDVDAVVRAIDHYRAGLGFADALHLASSSAARTFATFDQALVKRAPKRDILVRSP